MSQPRQQLRIIFSELARRVEFTSVFQHANRLPKSRLLGGQVEPKDGVMIKVAQVRPQTYGYDRIKERATAVA